MAQISNNTEPVHFRTATVYARKIEMGKQLVVLTGTHRGRFAKCDNGFLIIEQAWFPMKKKEKASK